MKTKPLSERITQGPWKAEGWNNLVVNAANGDTIVLAPGTSKDGSPMEARANAELIALAPTLLAQRDALLAACRECLACLCADSDSEEQYASEINQARQAIASAEKDGAL